MHRPLRPPHPSPLPHGLLPHSLGAIVGSIKSATTKHLNLLHNTPGMRIWQRNYYDHIIRNDDPLHHIRQYIDTNPLRWEEDQLHPNNPSNGNISLARILLKSDMIVSPPTGLGRLGRGDRAPTTTDIR